MCCAARRSRQPAAADRRVQHDLARRATAEAIGTAFLVAIVVGSGIYAQRLSPDDVGSAAAGELDRDRSRARRADPRVRPVSGAHFNPVVTLAERLLGGMTTRDAAVYVVAQMVGACVGAIVANLMFDLDAMTSRPTPGPPAGCGSASSSRPSACSS